jgi:hypothetical protein
MSDWLGGLGVGLWFGAIGTIQILAWLERRRANALVDAVMRTIREEDALLAARERRRATLPERLRTLDYARRN